MIEAKKPLMLKKECNVFIGLGSNLGERQEWLRMAVTSMNESGGVELMRESSIYETEPHGFNPQPDFLNQVVEIVTTLTPEELLEQMLRTERFLGRIRTIRWGPRTIDLDLLAFNDRQLDTRRLRLPHPEIARRRFVLEPWAEIAPDFMVPRLNLTVAELLRCCPDDSRVRRLEPHNVNKVLKKTPPE